MRCSTVASLVALVASASAQSLTQVLANTSSLSNLTTFLATQPAIVSQLSSAQNITILAPSNKAISALVSSGMGNVLLSNNTALISSLLTYHVLNGTYNSSQVTTNATFIPTLLGKGAYANVTGGQVVEAIKVGNDVVFYSGLRMNSTVSQADVRFSGGVIHVIDSFLVPPPNVSTTAVTVGLSSLAGALTRANLVQTVDRASDVTIFAPNNAAFQSIGSALSNISTQDLTSVLGYHVVAGNVLYSNKVANTTLTSFQGTNLTVSVINGTVFVNSAKVIQTDILVANGVVHVIDAVLNPAAATARPNATASSATPVFSGASSVSDTPFTSGIPQASVTLTNGAPGATGGSRTSSSSAGAAKATAVGAMGAGAMFAVAGWLVV